MVELGELEKRHPEFAARNVQVFVISNDNLEAAQANQADFPHLVVVSDEEMSMATAMEVIHPGAGQTGEDTNAPTTFLVDGSGQVRWYSRPGQVIARLSPQDVLAAIDKNL